MGFRIMNRELDGISLTGPECIKTYEEYRKYHINPNSTLYGDVLVETRRVFSGVCFKLKIYFKQHWYWKPHKHWKYGMYYFHWLFFMFWFEKEFIEVTDKIIKDHLSELNDTKN